MTFTIVENSPRELDPAFYNQGFHSVIEDHLDLFTTKWFTVKTIDKQTAYKYESDFYGLLKIIGVPYKYHWITLRTNGLNNPLDYDGITLDIKIPNEVKINKLRDTFIVRINLG